LKLNCVIIKPKINQVNYSRNFANLTPLMENIASFGDFDFLIFSFEVSS
jgi:hypothetical protein